MIGNEGFGVQRRALDVEDYIDIARRHKGWIFGPAFAALVVSVVGAFLYPDTYVSTASIRVIAQQVPTAYVTANINQQTQDRISSLAQSILSRSILASLVNTNGLYPKQLASKPIDDVVEDMRKDIKIGTLESVGGQTPGPKSTFPAFTISFAYTDRYKAQQVVRQLAGQFVDQNLRDRNRDSLMTNQLLRDNWDAAKKDLNNIETKLADFRIRNQGRLPDQMQGNMQQLTAAQTRLGALSDSLSR
jgi:succinoglycan biosynthesis transport protein ExoP